MNIEIIKNDIITYAKKYLLILIALAVVFSGTFFYKSNSQEKLNELNSSLMSMQANIIKKKNEYEQSTKSLKEYVEIDQNKLPTPDGLMLGRDRLRFAVENLEALRNTYLLRKLNISMSEIKEATTLKTQSFSVYEGVLKIEFSAPTDEYVYSFINDIKNIFPGFLKIKKLEIKKINGIDEATTANFFTSNTEGFVSGIVELEWLTLKSTGSKQGSLGKVGIGTIKQGN